MGGGLHSGYVHRAERHCVTYTLRYSAQHTPFFPFFYFDCIFISLHTCGCCVAYTVYNALEGSGRCLDVADHDGADGAAIQSWPCSKGSKDDSNYSQTFNLDTSTTPPRITTGSDQTGALCIVLGSMGNVLTLSCEQATPGSWIVYVTSETPSLRLGTAGTTALCLSAAAGAPAPPAPPSPSPSPPTPAPSPGPYERVPQACTSENTTGLPFCNPKLSIDRRVADLLKRMTAEEKLKQLIGGIGGGKEPDVKSHVDATITGLMFLNE